MIEARRAYADATGWIRAARPRRIEAGRFAARAFWGSFAAGVLVLGAVGLVAPATFGEPGVGTAAGRGLPALVLAGVVVAALAVGLSQGRRLIWVARRIREPFVRPLEEYESFEGAAGALAACPDALRARFAFGWVWGPAAVAVAGGTFAFSAAYFVVDAILARAQLGPGQWLMLAANFLLGAIAFRLGALRLSTWRIAASAYRDATGRYA
ncbi:MAG TPA: hypothetical protein VM784_06350 [Actinomycetota bacterium]|nr:hypothetical protein [Actinomycetota bacterium]